MNERVAVYAGVEAEAAGGRAIVDPGGNALRVEVGDGMVREIGEHMLLDVGSYLATIPVPKVSDRRAIGAHLYRRCKVQVIFVFDPADDDDAAPEVAP